MINFLKKCLSRLALWLRVLRNFRGLTLRSVINLYPSALVDSLLYAFPGTPFNPRLVLKGLCFYKVKDVGLVIVRGGTDDFYYLIPRREGDVEEFIRSYLRNGSVFVDVGANIGYYTLIASKLVGSQGRVYSVEPIPSTAMILRANVRLNDCSNVAIYEAAAWSSRGALTLRMPKEWYGLTLHCA